jgi:hypothetical protein
MRRGTSHYHYFAGLLLLAVLWISMSARAADTSKLELVTESGTHPFLVELALTGDERSVGLMNREQMADNAGMLFRFDRQQRAMMWMKNTLIPLDMIFIRADGTVADIHRNAVPHSESIIRSSEPILYVLELNGGMADRFDIKPGNLVVHPIIEEK